MRVLLSGLLCACLCWGQTYTSVQPGFYVPGYLQQPALNNNASISNGNTIDTSTEKWGVCGTVETGGSTKSIHELAWKWGTINKSNGSVAQVSLQDVDTSSGPPARPDGTPDQTYTIANGDAGWASDTWYTTGALSADRSVADGTELCVVWEFSSFVAGDSFFLNYLNLPYNMWYPNSVNFNGTAWGTWNNANSNVEFIFSDSSVGAFSGSLPSFTTTATNINTGTTPDEVALEFQLPYGAKSNGAECFVTPASSSTFDIILYDASSTSLASASLVYAGSLGNTAQPVNVGWNDVTLSASTTYRLAIKPTTANNVGIHYITVGNAGVLGTWPGGTAFTFAERTDGGSWSTTDTQRLRCAIKLSAIQTGSAGGSGTGPSVVF